MLGFGRLQVRPRARALLAAYSAHMWHDDDGQGPRATPVPPGVQWHYVAGYYETIAIRLPSRRYPVLTSYELEARCLCPCVVQRIAPHMHARQRQASLVRMADSRD